MFEKEISYINNDFVKRVVNAGINILPEYFFHVPASSSGKYHPNYALGDGGLYRHTRAAVGVAVELFRIYNFSEIERDMIVAALILHDGWKQGGDAAAGYTLTEHPLIASQKISQAITPRTTDEYLILRFICSNIESHMGQWNTNHDGVQVLPLPSTEMEKFVHLCDYIASRKCLEFVFDAV